MLNDIKSLKIDLLFIDEAQKIGDKHRGILLEETIEQSLRNNPNIRIYFSSPAVANPELLLENINNSSKQWLNDDFVSVNQNLITVNQIRGKPKEFEISSFYFGKKIGLKNFTIENKCSKKENLLSYVPYMISEDTSRNLIYVNGAAEAEKIAGKLAAYLPRILNNNDINSLIKQSKDVVHKDFALAKVLENGVAFHYGNMPQLIREEIERLFKEGYIKYLVCTSTLLEGVNLPTKSIFIYNPKRGKGNPLNDADFWNLAGRAGRWGKEYSGNIICINSGKWKSELPLSKSKLKIEKATKLSSDNEINLLSYIEYQIKDEFKKVYKQLEWYYEFALGYYYSKFLNDQKFASSQFELDLTKKFIQIKNELKLPNDIIKRNIGISPLAQNDLYNELIILLDCIEDYIPVKLSDKNSYENYKRIILLINKFFYLGTKSGEIYSYEALLVSRWIRGFPLSKIIDEEIKHDEKLVSEGKRKEGKKTPSVIRDTMDKIENFVRFEFVKNSFCYVDILRFVLEENGKGDLIEKIPAVYLWLEFGVNQDTQISLISLGLSRYSAIELSKHLDGNLGKEETLSALSIYLRSNFFDLPESIQNDIDKNLSTLINIPSL